MRAGTKWGTCLAVGALLAAAPVHIETAGAQVSLPRAAPHGGGAHPASAMESMDSVGVNIAMLNVALYTRGANDPQPSDTARALLATRVLRDALREHLGAAALADSAAVAEVTSSDRAREITGGKACNVIVDCAREAGRELGARWVVMSKVSKTSNLIWLFSGQLIDNRTGRFVLDDTTELKGDPTTMIPAGTKIFAERVARAVKQGTPTP
ncbi:MAG TPA: DUF2380 domain-containing protein [Gemmatimonadales bacterium]|nr:DUF2380 domain-containing protein [Gemmatimonadales bacterium]